MTTKPPNFALPPEVNARLLALASELAEVGEFLSSRYGRQSQKWKETDAGINASARLEDLDNLVEAMNEFAEPITKESPSHA
jgi:hypothetical protein